MKKLLSLLPLFAALLCPTLLSAKAFEGTVSMEITSGRGSPIALTYSIKNGMLRTDMEPSAGMKAAAIMDLTKGQMTILMPAQSMYMVMPIKQAAEKAAGIEADEITLENTGETETILGHTCTKYLAKAKNNVTEIWATTELGTGMNGPMGGMPSGNGWMQALVGKEFFPLRVVGESFRLETTAVEAKTLPASQFTPPPGYRKLEMGGMMKAMGGNPFGR